MIHFCDKNKFRVFLNLSNNEVTKKFTEINRNPKLIKKFVLVIEAVKNKIANKTQYNWEDSCPLGEIYAIKVNEHRFYTLETKNDGYKNLFICRYAKKQSQQNSKKLTSIIESIPKITIQTLLK